MKQMTRKQLEKRKAQAVRFTQDVLGDDERADEIEDESLEDYAEHRRIKLTNPKGAHIMPVPSRSDLLERIDNLESENEDLQAQLDEIADIVAPPDEESDEDDQGNDDEGEE